MKKTISGLVRGTACAVIVASGLAGLWQHTPGAHAAVASRRDPILLISTPTASGATLTLVQVVASISANSTQVKGVSFAIHGPVGSSLTKELLTGAGETYTYTADRVDTSYSTVTTVTVSGAAVPVTVTSSVLATDMQTVLYQSTAVAGMSGKGITTTVCPVALANTNAGWGS